MDNLLFSSRSIWTMLHGVLLGGGALMALAAALFALAATPASDPARTESHQQAQYVSWLLVFIAVTLWLTVFVGTYVSFPAYRAPPPEGLIDLAHSPRSLILSNPRTAWLHSFAMELKEHAPWVSAMVATAVAYTGVKYRTRLLNDVRLRRTVIYLLSVCFVIVAGVSLLGVLINKVAPLE